MKEDVFSKRAPAQYRDLIGRAHHVSPRRPPMSRLNRAAQFAPFAALTGYEEMIGELEGERSRAAPR